MSEYGIGLAAQHTRMLAESKVTPEAAHARGYRTVTEKTRLESIGITKAGRSVPGLLVPSRGANGEVWGYQYRPDTPRLRGGKPVKYETPVGQRNGIDIPPDCLEQIGDPRVPLWVTEGVKKADAGACAGLCVVALPGVWSWRGRNSHGGKTAVPDWHDIALNDRRVVLAFDSDVVRKPAVRHALSELAGYLGAKGAKVEHCHLPDDDATKTGLDDYLADGHTAADLWALVRPEMPAATAEQAPPASGGSGGSGRSGGSQGGVGGERPEDGGVLLDELDAALARYVILPTGEAVDAVTLWIAATHAQRALNSAPRLVIKSPEKRCGKSRLLDVIEATCHRPFMTFNATVAAVVRSIDADNPPTLLVDEADAIWSKAKASEGAEDLRALLNAGFGRGRPVVRCVGPESKPTEFPSFAMAALAGIGDTIPDTITDRAVIVRMRRRAPGEHVSPFRQRRDGEPLHELRDRLQAWATRHLDALEAAEPELPVEDRAADVWEPLVAVADRAGGTWPERARRACQVLTDAAAEDDGDTSLNLRLLADLREVFEGHDRMHSATIVEALADIEDAPWGDYFGRSFTVADLSRRLKGYGLKAEKQLWIGATNRSGFTRDQLHDVWRRYLPVPPSIPSRDANPQVNPLDQKHTLDAEGLGRDLGLAPDQGASASRPSSAPLGLSPRNVTSPPAPGGTVSPPEPPEPPERPEPPELQQASPVPVPHTPPNQPARPAQPAQDDGLALLVTPRDPAPRRPTCGDCGTVLHDGVECLRCRYEEVPA